MACFIFSGRITLFVVSGIVSFLHCSAASLLRNSWQAQLPHAQQALLILFPKKCFIHHRSSSSYVQRGSHGGGLTGSGGDAVGKRFNHADLLCTIVSRAAVKILPGMLSTTLVSTSGTREK